MNSPKVTQLAAGTAHPQTRPGRRPYASQADMVRASLAAVPGRGTSAPFVSHTGRV